MMYQVIRVWVGHVLGTGQCQAGLSLDETEREPSAIAVHEAGRERTLVF